MPEGAEKAKAVKKKQQQEGGGGGSDSPAPANGRSPRFAEPPPASPPTGTNRPRFCRLALPLAPVVMQTSSHMAEECGPPGSSPVVVAMVWSRRLSAMCFCLAWRSHRAASLIPLAGWAAFAGKGKVLKEAAKRKKRASPKGRGKKERRDALDPLTFISKSFQKSCTGAGVDEVVRQVSDNLKRLDKEISDQVQNSKSLGNHIDETKGLIHKAVASVTELRKEAAQAVDEADVVVGRARYASTHHMVKALDGLTYLKEIRSSINQCRKLRDQAQYAAIAPHLKKQEVLKPYFRTYSDIPVIDKVLTEVDEFQEDLLSEIVSEFKQSYGQVEDDTDFAARLAASAQLMDCMGEHAAHDLRKWFVARKQDELEYFVLTIEGKTVDDLRPRKVDEMEEAVAQAQQALEELEQAEEQDDDAIEAAQAVLQEKSADAEQAGIEAAKTDAYNASRPATLDDLCERYQWLEDELDTYTYTYMDIFPASWEVSEAFTHKCCMYLRGFVEEIIVETKPLNIDLQAFMERTLEFEEFLSDRYAAAAAASRCGSAPTLVAVTRLHQGQHHQ